MQINSALEKRIQRGLIQAIREQGLISETVYRTLLEQLR